MALIPVITGSISKGGLLLTVTDITGVYDATNNPGGFSTPNYAAAAIFKTIIKFGLAGTVYTVDSGITIPSPDTSNVFEPLDIGLDAAYFPDCVARVTAYYAFTTFSGGNVDVTNGSATITRASGQDFTVDFAGASHIYVNGQLLAISSKTATTITLDLPATFTFSGVAYATYSAFVAIEIIEQYKKCYFPKVATVTVVEGTCCLRCNNEEEDAINELVNQMLGLFSISLKMVEGLYDSAEADINTLNKICASSCC